MGPRAGHKNRDPLIWRLCHPVPDTQREDTVFCKWLILSLREGGHRQLQRTALRQGEQRGRALDFPNTAFDGEHRAVKNSGPVSHLSFCEISISFQIWSEVLFVKVRKVASCHTHLLYQHFGGGGRRLEFKASLSYIRKLKPIRPAWNSILKNSKSGSLIGLDLCKADARVRQVSETPSRSPLPLRNCILSFPCVTSCLDILIHQLASLWLVLKFFSMTLSRTWLPRRDVPKRLVNSLSYRWLCLLDVTNTPCLPSTCDY